MSTLKPGADPTISTAHDSVWERHYAALQRYHKIHGDCHFLPPTQYDDAVEEKQSNVQAKVLSHWTRHQRKYKRQLTPAQIDKLNALDFDWDNAEPKCHPDNPAWNAPSVFAGYGPEYAERYRSTCNNQVRWEIMFEKLKAFREVHGHCRVPIRWKRDPALGKWVSRQRETRTNLKEDMRHRLEAIGFEWRLKPWNSRRGDCDKRDAEWTEKFKTMKAYMERTKHRPGRIPGVPFCRPNPNARTTHERALAFWGEKQRILYEQGNLRWDRKKALEGVNFDFYLSPSTTAQTKAFMLSKGSNSPPSSKAVILVHNPQLPLPVLEPFDKKDGPNTNNKNDQKEDSTATATTDTTDAEVVKKCDYDYYGAKGIPDPYDAKAATVAAAAGATDKKQSSSPSNLPPSNPQPENSAASPPLRLMPNMVASNLVTPEEKTNLFQQVMATYEQKKNKSTQSTSRMQTRLTDAVPCKPATRTTAHKQPTATTTAATTTTTTTNTGPPRAAAPVNYHHQYNTQPTAAPATTTTHAHHQYWMSPSAAAAARQYWYPNNSSTTQRIAMASTRSPSRKRRKKSKSSSSSFLRIDWNPDGSFTPSLVVDENDDVNKQPQDTGNSQAMSTSSIPNNNNNSNMNDQGRPLMLLPAPKEESYSFAKACAMRLYKEKSAVNKKRKCWVTCSYY